MKTKEQKLALLEDTILYYSKKVSRRCTTKTDGIKKCKYSGKTLGIKTKGCAIGRLLKSKLRDFLDIEYKDKSSTVSDVFEDLPKSIKEYGESFLTMLQDLHDDDKNWSNEGLTGTGLKRYREIKKSIK